MNIQKDFKESIINALRLLYIDVSEEAIKEKLGSMCITLNYKLLNMKSLVEINQKIAEKHNTLLEISGSSPEKGEIEVQITYSWSLH